MKRLLFILLLLIARVAIAQPTQLSPLGSYNTNVYNNIVGSLRVANYVKIPSLAGADTIILIVTPDSIVRKIPISRLSGGGGGGTSYSAGYGLNLSGTTFYIDSTEAATLFALKDSSNALRNYTISLLGNYYTKAQSDTRYLQSYTETDPVWIADSSDYYKKTAADALLAGKSDVGHTHTFASLTDKPTTKSGYGITDVPTYGDTASLLATKTDKDSLQNALKYIQLNNITTSAPQLDYIIMDGDTNTWDNNFRETGNCVWFPKISKWVYMYAGYTGTYAQNNIYLGVLTSPDLKTWTKVGTDGKISTRSAEDPYILVRGDSLFAYAEDKEDVPFRNIRLFVSDDAVTWYDKGDVLDIGTGSDWDSRDVSSPVVKKIGDTTYMWFEGRATGQLGAIGMATSTDGYNWTKYGGNPVVTGTNLTDSTFNWATHVVCHDVDIVNDDIYLFVTPYVGSLAEFTSSIVLGSVSSPYRYKDYLGTWLPKRRDIGGGGMKTWVNNRYVLFGVDTSATKITTMKFTSIVNGDFVNKPIITDTALVAKDVVVKNAIGYSATISNSGTANRAQTLPDKDGTFAMTSDIPDVSIYKEKSDSTNAVYGYVTQAQIDSAKKALRAEIATKQNSLGYTPEDVANKATSFSTINNTLYPTVQACSTYIDGLGYVTSSSVAATYIPYTGATKSVDLGNNNFTAGNATVDTLYGGTGSGGNIVYTSTSNATKGKHIFGTSAYDEANNRWGIGTTTPGARLDVVGQSRSIAYGSAAQMICVAYGGTSGSPTATAIGEIGSFGGAGSGDGSTTTGRRAAYSIYATEVWTSTANGSALDFRTTANGSTGSTVRGRVDQDGTFLLGTTTNPSLGSKLHIAGSISQTSVTSALLKADANGVHVAATAGTDYATPASVAGKVDSVTKSNDTFYYWTAGVKTFIGIDNNSGGGISDGDKGDITVSGSGATWTIDNGAVSLAKMADMATASILGRNTAGTGAPEVLSAATTKTLLSLNNVDNTSDATKNSATATLTNKTLTAPIISSITNTGTLTLPTVTSTISSYKTSNTSSSSTPAPTGDAKDNYYQLTALATAPTFAAPSGTPADGNTLLIRIKDNGTARALAWNAIYRGGTSIALPTTTTISKTMYVQFIYNSADSKWDLIGLTDGL